MTYNRARLVALLFAAVVLLVSSAFGARDATVRTRPLAAHGVPAGGAAYLPGHPGSPGAASATPTRTGSRDAQQDPHAGKPPRPPAGTSPQPSTAPATQTANSTFGPAGSARLTGSAGVALTFDDGPDPVNTPKILDLLAQHGVKATFCVVGTRVRAHPELVQRIVADGHTLCNHSWQHLLNLAQRPADYINWDLNETNNYIRLAVPDAKIKYFRAPGGNFTPSLVAKAKEMGMASIYWAVDPRDWEHKEGSDGAHIDHVINGVRNYTHPGSIVLSHDNGQPDTIVAYQTLIPWLKDRFTLIALPD